MPLQLTRQNTYKFSPPKPIEEYSKDSIKKMAVLFTDIVGSSKYFKAHGDIAGRKMLKLHQDMASPIITEFSGTVVKMLGDSVMAFFLNPKEALRSAIKLQHKFQSFNKQNKKKDQIHIRICIHYGDGIIDEGDIFGDVVNMAAKFLPIAEGDQIVISSELHSHLKETPYVSYEKINLKNKNNLLNDLDLLRVVWKEDMPLNPSMKTIIILKPVWGLGRKDFSGIWKGLLNQRINLWSKNILDKEIINPDYSVNLILKEAPLAMDIGLKVINYLRTNMGHEGTILIPVQIVIASGPFSRAGNIFIEKLDVNWKEIEPGDIYISEKAFKYVNINNNIEVERSINSIKNGFLKVITRETQKQDKNNIFRYQNALTRGDYSPCFYCGNRSHRTSDCPSKDINDLTRFTEKLGYMQLEEINNLFFNYIHETRLNGDIKDEAHSINKTGSTQLAYHSFYELKSVIQLRLFRALWNRREDNWNRIKEIKDDSDKGGLLWICLDCIRVSNFDQAESIIQSELEKKNRDYKLLCLAGLLYIEKNNFRQAKLYLKKALDLANRSPQKIFILFLLSRIHHLSSEPNKARDMLRRIIRLNPHCSEAIYQEIVFRFRNGDKSVALDQLVKLIQKNKDYYIIALIDPELGKFSNKIHLRLEELLKVARDEANRITPLIQEEIVSIEKQVGHDAEEIKEAKSLVSKIEALLKTDSYFGYLDILHYGGTINSLGRRIIEGRESRLYKRQRNLKQRIEKCHNYMKTFSYKVLTESVSHQLRTLEKRLEATKEKIKLEGVEEFDNLIRNLNNFSEELTGIESKLGRLNNINQLMVFALNFIKKNVIFQSANLLVSLILLPIMIHYLNFIVPELNLSTQGIWHYQKLLIVLGGISGLILATIASQKSTTS